MPQYSDGWMRQTSRRTIILLSILKFHIYISFLLKNCFYVGDILVVLPCSKFLRLVSKCVFNRYINLGF